MPLIPKVQIKVTLLNEVKRPEVGETKESRLASLRERVLYAIDCFETGHNPEASFKFLKEVYNRISEKEDPSPAYRELLDLMRPIMDEFGALEGVHVRGDLLF